MKRSEINANIQKVDEYIHSCGFYLPPFTYWKPETWMKKGTEVNEIAENKLGWDITEFGKGDFETLGLFLFPLYNGNLRGLQKLQGRLYAEKIKIVEAGQITLMHFHWNKMEDTILMKQAADDISIQS